MDAKEFLTKMGAEVSVDARHELINYCFNKLELWKHQSKGSLAMANLLSAEIICKLFNNYTVTSIDGEDQRGLFVNRLMARAIGEFQMRRRGCTVELFHEIVNDICREYELVLRKKNLP